MAYQVDVLATGNRVNSNRIMKNKTTLIKIGVVSNIPLALTVLVVSVYLTPAPPTSGGWLIID